MIKLKKVLESSARERLKKRVKDSSGISKLDIHPKYIHIVNKYYDKSRDYARFLEIEYQYFYETTILKVRPAKEYFERIMYLFNNLNDDTDDVDLYHPDRLDRDAERAISDDFEKIINKVEIPSGNEPVRGIAFLLQFLEKNGFEIRKFGRYKG